MHPTIPSDTVLHILPLAGKPLKRGNIVLYETCGRLTAHRYVRAARCGGRIYMVADAALNGGVWVAADAVLGVAAWAHIGGRRRRLDTVTARGRGLLRYALRPLRRGLHRLCCCCFAGLTRKPPNVPPPLQRLPRPHPMP